MVLEIRDIPNHMASPEAPCGPVVSPQMPRLAGLPPRHLIAIKGESNFFKTGMSLECATGACRVGTVATYALECLGVGLFYYSGETGADSEREAPNPPGLGSGLQARPGPSWHSDVTDKQSWPKISAE